MKGSYLTPEHVHVLWEGLEGSPEVLRAVTLLRSGTQKTPLRL